MACTRCSELLSRWLELVWATLASPKRTEISNCREPVAATAGLGAAAGLGLLLARVFKKLGMLGNTRGASLGCRPMKPASSLLRTMRPEAPSKAVEPAYTRL